MANANPKPIKIKEQGRINDNDCRKTLSKRAGHKVEWRANGNGGPWKVVFINGSPFVDKKGKPIMEFRVPKGGTASSGIAAGDNRNYKYEVWEDKPGGICKDDPEILIQD